MYSRMCVDSLVRVSRRVNLNLLRRHRGPSVPRSENQRNETAHVRVRPSGAVLRGVASTCYNSPRQVSTPATPLGDVGSGRTSQPWNPCRLTFWDSAAPVPGRLPARRLRCEQGRQTPWTPFPETCRFKALILQRFQARLTLFSKYFAPFPHGTCSLSDSRKY